MTPTWTVMGEGLRRIEQVSGGPVVHFVDTVENPVEVVILSDHVAAVEAAENEMALYAFNRALDRAREAVVALGHVVDCVWSHEEDLPCPHEEVLAALDALKAGQS